VFVKQHISFIYFIYFINFYLYIYFYKFYIFYIFYKFFNKKRMFKSTLLLDGNRAKVVVSSIRRKYTKLSNKSFMKYNYLTIFYIFKGTERSNFIKALTCKARKQKIKCEIKNIKAGIHIQKN